MRIEVYKDWIIRSVPNNIILCKSAGFTEDAKTKKPIEQFKDETYHASVEQALKTLCRKEIEACKATTFKGLQHEYEKLSELLKNIGEQLGERGVLK
jgi:hypothetical protein